MTKRMCIIATLCFLAAALNVYAGAPLKGVDVKLGKNPGGSPAARATSDSDGKVAFGILPAGSYLMTLSLQHGHEYRADIPVVTGDENPHAITPVPSASHRAADRASPLN